MADEYLELGEFHDLFMVEAWDAFVPALRATFGDLGPEARILDLGAGSGMGTARLAGATRAQILAVEPSLTMRSVLLARVADDPALSSRVSVLAGAAPDALDEIDGPVDGFVCAHILGHLTPTERRETLARLAALLAPDGIGLLTVPREEQPPASDVTVEERRIGRHRYVVRHLPSGADGVALAEYGVLDGERVVRSASFASTWAMPSLVELRGEVRRAGLRFEPMGDAVAVVRPRARSVPTLADVRGALPLVDRCEVIDLASAARRPDRAPADDRRAATYPTRLALTTLACADQLRASARRVGIAGARVLDLACGPAMISRILLDAGARQVDGADADPNMIAAARALPPARGLTLRVADATGRLPFPDGAFDIVWLGDFWSSRVLPEVQRVLRPGGRLVLRATAAFDWLPHDDPAFVARVSAATEAGLARWEAGCAVAPFEELPTADLPGWSLCDTWTETTEVRHPIPAVAEEDLLQDFACFHGRFAAAELSAEDWRRLCALADPDSPDRVVARPDARLAWAFDYRVFTPATGS